MNRLVVVLNGPNLNLQGKRRPHIHGHEILADVERDCQAFRRHPSVSARADSVIAGFGMQGRLLASRRAAALPDVA